MEGRQKTSAAAYQRFMSSRGTVPRTHRSVDGEGLGPLFEGFAVLAVPGHHQARRWHALPEPGEGFE